MTIFKGQQKWEKHEKEKIILNNDNLRMTTKWCLDITSTTTSTTSDLHKTSQKFIVHGDNLLLWQFNPVTIVYCYIPTQSARIVNPPQKKSLSQRDTSSTLFLFS